jgi:hypothetical protein
MVVTEVSQFREQASPDRERPLILQEERAIGILTELNTVLAAAQDNLM